MLLGIVEWRRSLAPKCKRAKINLAAHRKLPEWFPAAMNSMLKRLHKRKFILYFGLLHVNTIMHRGVPCSFSSVWAFKNPTNVKGLLGQSTWKRSRGKAAESEFGIELLQSCRSTNFHQMRWGTSHGAQDVHFDIPCTSLTLRVRLIISLAISSSSSTSKLPRAAKLGSFTKKP